MQREKWSKEYVNKQYAMATFLMWLNNRKDEPVHVPDDDTLWAMTLAEYRRLKRKKGGK